MTNPTTLSINANARGAIRKAISQSPLWDEYRRLHNLSLASISKDDAIRICRDLGLDIHAIVAAAAAADFPDDDTAAKAVVPVNRKLDPSQFPNDAVSAAAIAAQPSPPENDDLATLAKLAGTLGHTVPTPFSSDVTDRLSKVTALVRDDANFGQWQGYALDAADLLRRIEKAVTEQPATIPAPKVATYAPTFIAPTWEREFRDFLDINATVAIVGPSGNGKTTAARAMLEASGYVVYEMDCTDATLPHDIIGRTALENDNGATVTKWHAGPMVKAFNDPRGALLLNEYDALDPRTSMALQSALEAGAIRRVTSPDSGEQFRSIGPCPIVLTLNTIGHGATSQYQGRNALDGANRDRVEIIVTGYEHEEAIMVAHGAEKRTAETLVTWAKNARKTLAAINSNEILSNRRLLTAAKLIDGRAMSLSEAVERAFICRLDEMTRDEFRSTFDRLR